MENFVKAISSIPYLSTNDISLFKSICHSIDLRKGDFWTKEKHTSDKVGFIESGYIRKFYYKDDKEITDSFYFENSFTADLPSLITNSPSLANAIAEEDTSITWFSCNDMNELCRSSHMIEHFVRTMIEKTFTQFYYRSVSFIMKSPKERYDDLINEYVQVLQRAKQYHIASYLGISAQHLSRLRSGQH
jgi:CRP-like cAMP-binding protein